MLLVKHIDVTNGQFYYLQKHQSCCLTVIGRRSVVLV